jgi:hypothetical protein
VDHPQRYIYLALMIAWAIYRLIRYVRMATSKRPGPAPPPPTPAATPAATQSPLDPAGGAGSGFAANLAAVGVFVGGNVVIWPLLFMVPALEGVPTSLRLVAGVLANLFLIYLARGIAGRAGSSQRSPGNENDPIK